MALVGGVGRVAWAELRRWGQPQRLGDDSIGGVVV
jgi:hypothetical protein